MPVFFRIPAHRMILYTANDYFKAMFATGSNTSGQSEILIGSVGGAVLQKLIEYCYGKKISVDSANVNEMIKAATILRFARVQAKCVQAYSKNLGVSNCLGIREVADLLNMGHLKEMAHHFALDHFVEVSKFDEFHQLSVGHLAPLLKHDEINVAKEEKIFDALIGWIKYDVRNRYQWFPILSKCVRFQLVDDSVSKRNSSISLRSFMSSSFQFMLDRVNERCIEVDCPDVYASIVERRSSRQEREIPRSPPLQINLIRADSRVKIDRFYARHNAWTEVETLDLEISCFAVIHRDDKLILIGGDDPWGRATDAVSNFFCKFLNKAALTFFYLFLFSGVLHGFEI